MSGENKKTIFANSIVEGKTQKFDEQIRTLQEELLKNESEYQYDTYLSKVFEDVNKHFETHFGKNYIFAKAYYLPSMENPPLTTVEFCRKSDKNRVFYNGIKEAERMVKEKEASSLAEYVVTQDILGVILYKSQNKLNKKGNDVPPKFTAYMFNDSDNPFTIIDSQKGINTSKMVLQHKKMADESGYSDLYSYVLRTRNLDKDFNGTLYLVMTRKLTIDEYREIIDYFTFIMQARIKWEYKPQVEDDEWKRMIEQITHSKYNQRAVVNNNSKRFEKELENKGLDDLLALFKKNEMLRRNIDKIDDFFFALNKVEHSRQKFESLMQSRIKEVLQTEEINFTEILNEQIEVVENSLDVIPFNTKNHKKNIQIYLTTFRNEIGNKFEKIRLNAVLEGFRIILLDMLKNAVRYTDDEKPEVRIELYPYNESEIDEWQIKRNDFNPKEGEYMTLAFLNNSPIVVESEGEVYTKDYENLLGKIVSDKTSNTSQLGIRIIRTIIKYDGLGRCGKRWFYTPSKECLNRNETKILLIIPKTDFSHGI